MNIDLIAGAWPNFMKIAPIIDAIKAKTKQLEQASSNKVDEAVEVIFDEFLKQNV